MKPYSTVEIFGIPVSRMSMKETVDYLVDVVHAQSLCQVVTINPIMIMDALKEPSYMSSMLKADLIVPDGTGVVWAAERKGTPVAERVPGFDLLHELMDAASSKSWRVYLLGASDEVIQEARATLAKQYPGVQFVGCRNGYFTDAEDQEVIADIRAKQPHMLFVGRSALTQDSWIAKYRDQLMVPIMMGVGGSFDVISGRLKRAPKLWQKLRLEWLYRLILQPWRFKRMLALPRFVLKVRRDRTF